MRLSSWLRKYSWFSWVVVPVGRPLKMDLTIHGRFSRPSRTKKEINRELAHSRKIVCQFHKMSKCSAKGHISKSKIVRQKTQVHCKPTTEGSPEKTFSFSKQIIHFPQFVKNIGPKQKEILSKFIPSAVTYGITSLLFIVYITEWKAVLKYAPLYRSKFTPEE
ncbi:hypothetical protein NQ315_015233 [Exocentrus adspersus]|uniref:Cytochrome b-c1 complex subunit 8 n=1 Tax=Exocentrus adspersus TaxID=1586481 RepID=A0AAV8VBP8_9CUCU|nr:hypothetical protein NQ315_015233 [Exocentrus adspersus]